MNMIKKVVIIITTYRIIILKRMYIHVCRYTMLYKKRQKVDYIRERMIYIYIYNINYEISENNNLHNGIEIQKRYMQIEEKLQHIVISKDKSFLLYEEKTLYDLKRYFYTNIII